MKINPIYKKEFISSVRTLRMSIILLGYNLFLGVIGLLLFYFVFDRGDGYGRLYYENTLSMYIVMAMIEFALVLFVVPVFTAGSIAGEREKQTLEILLTTDLKPIQIIMGKLMSSISSLLLLAISSMPVLSIVSVIGGVRYQDLLQLLFLFFVTAFFIGSIGIFFSSLFKRTVSAAVFTYGCVVLLTLGTLLIVGLVSLMISSRMDYTVISSSYNPDVGNLALILLLNPIFTIISMMIEQVGTLSDMISNFGTTSEFVLKNWFWISVGVQLIISTILLFMSARILDPLKGREERIRIKKNR